MLLSITLVTPSARAQDVYALEPENVHLFRRIADLIEADYPE